MPLRGDMIARLGIELEYPVRIVGSAPAMEHVPFAMWIIEAHQPRLVVELGPKPDNTYCGLLQAARALNLEAKCFGFSVVDSADDDPANGSDFKALKAYHDLHYGAFSTLSRGSLADALMRFADHSIDLLQVGAPVDDENPFEAFDAWLPKMSSRGVILVHGIAAQPRNANIQAFWDKVSSGRASFAFAHDRGLGIVHVGGEPPSARLQALLEAREPRDMADVRAYFSRLGASVAERAALRAAQAKLAELAQAGGEQHAAAPRLPAAQMQRDVLTRIIREQSLTVIQL